MMGVHVTMQRHVMSTTTLAAKMILNVIMLMPCIDSSIHAWSGADEEDMNDDNDDDDDHGDTKSSSSCSPR